LQAFFKVFQRGRDGWEDLSYALIEHLQLLHLKSLSGLSFDELGEVEAGLVITAQDPQLPIRIKWADGG
jgi:hypothetical protein